MPVFKLTSPTGKVFKVTGPDGSTEEDAYQILMESMGAGDGPTAPPSGETRRPVQYTPDEYSPPGVRAKVGNARTQEDKLATLQSMYPGATAHGDNFRYTGTEGQKVQFNKPGMDVGDFAEWGRVPAEMLGGAIAASPTIMGAPATSGASLVVTPLAYGLGAESAGHVYDMIMGSHDTRSLLDRTKAGLFGIAANTAGGPVGKVDDAVTLGHAAAAKRRLQDTAAASDRIGAPQSLAQSTGSKRAQALENYVESTPFGGDVINRQREAAAAAVGDVYETLSGQAMHSPDAMGSEILQGATDLGVRKRAREKVLWENVEGSFKKKGNSTMSPIDIDDLAALSETTKKRVGAYRKYGDLATNKPLNKLIRMTNKSLDDVDEFGDLVPGELPPYEAVKTMRSNIGADINNAFLVKPGGAQGSLKQIYAAASKDLEAAAETLGGKAGVAARHKANDYTRQISRQFEELERILGIPKGNATQTMDARSVDIYNKSKNAFLNNPKAIRKIFKAMSAKQKQRFLAQMIKDMGLAKPGVQDETGALFSPATFSTAWARLKQKAPENLKLFSKEHRKQLDDIALVASSLKKAKVGTNYSASGKVLQAPVSSGLGAITGGIVGGPMGAGAGVVAANAIPYALGRALTSGTTRNAYQTLDSMGLLNMDDLLMTSGRRVAGGMLGQ